jgi:gliding motility-associated lipoprotein GldH
MGKRNKSYLFFLLLAIIVVPSCNRDVVFSGSEIMKKNTWNLMNVLSFEIPVSDTVNSHNIIFTIRTGTAYPFRNIYLFVKTVSPDGRGITDTLQYNIADEKGKWIGKGFGDIRELNLPFKSNVYFPVKGSYMISVQHGMREEDLKGVYDFGLRVVRIRKK